VAATALSLFVLEIRHIKVLSMLDGQRWASRFGSDESGAGPEPEGTPQDD